MTGSTDPSSSAAPAAAPSQYVSLSEQASVDSFSSLAIATSGHRRSTSAPAAPGVSSEYVSLSTKHSTEIELPEFERETVLAEFEMVSALFQWRMSFKHTGFRATVAMRVKLSSNFS